MNTTTFDCPRCGAPLDPPPSASSTLECPYCKNTVVIPTELRPTPPAYPNPRQLPLAAPDPSQMAEIRRLISEGKKIEAIRLLRERMDLPLSVANTTVTLLAAGLPLPDALSQASRRTSARVSTSPQATAASPAGKTAIRTAIGGLSCFTAFIIFSGLIVPLVAVSLALFQPSGLFGELGARLNPFALARLELAFGEEGPGQGMFTRLVHLAPAPDGTLYTAESESGRIQHFDEQGSFLNLWFVPGTETQDEVYIEGLAVSPQGLVYALARGEIFVYTGDGKPLDHLMPELNGDRLLIRSLRFGPDGTPYALASSEILLRFDLAWQPELLKEEIIESVTKDAESSAHLALDSSGFVYILGGDNRAVFKFDRDGAFLNRFGSDGDEKGQFNYVYGLAIDAYGRVFISETDGLQVFDSEGRFLRQVVTPGGATDLSFDAQNRLWLARFDERILRYAVAAP